MQFLAGIINVLDWVNGKILWVCRMATMALVGAIALNVFVGVFWRYVLNDSLPWYEESSLYMMLWMVFVACPIVLKQGGHISFDVLPKKLAPPTTEPQLPNHLYSCSGYCMRVRLAGQWACVDCA